MYGDSEFEFIVAFWKLGIRGFEGGTTVACVRFVDGANRFVGAIIFGNDAFEIIVQYFEEGVVQVGHSVGKVVACNGEQFLVRIREDVEPGFFGDLCAFVTDVKERGRGGVVKAGGISERPR